jgi:hypothetical protein
MKKEIRLEVFKEGHDLARFIPQIIQGSNEGETKATVTDIYGHLRCCVAAAPTAFRDVRISLINDQLLTVDDNMECVLEVREVELHELDVMDVPTLAAYQLNHE